MTLEGSDENQLRFCYKDSEFVDQPFNDFLKIGCGRTNW